MLHPYGPLRYAMELDLHRRRNAIEFNLPPGLIYKGFRFSLGTGDFIFYGVIAARAVQHTFMLVACVCNAMTFGVILTILWTVNSDRHATPALPIALGLGIPAFFIGLYALTPFCAELWSEAVVA